MNIKFDYAAISDIGMVRKNNEDNVYMPNLPVREPKCNIYKNSGSIATDKSFFCVCDGMGGHSAGEVASYIAVSHVAQNYSKVIELIDKKSKIVSIFRDFISNTNEVIYDAAQKNSEFTSMGTTMTGICFMGGYAHFVNIGDSRVYTISKTKLKQLSVDHTDAENTHALTRFLGMSSIYGQVFPDVDSKGEKIGFGKRFLLCSDGLTDMVDNAMISDILIKEDTPETAAERLVDEAKKKGGRDNITVLVIDAKPTNKTSVFLKSKYTLIVLCVALIASASGTYYLNSTPKGGGSSLSDISKDIENAENIIEAKKVFDDYFASIETQINDYDAFTANVDESDNSVKTANDELKKSLQSLKSNKDALKTEYDNLINGTMSDEALFSAIQALEKTSVYMDIEKDLTECENKKSNVDNALLTFQKMREEQNRKNDSNGSASNSSSGKGNNSKNRGSSNGGNSNSGSDDSGVSYSAEDSGSSTSGNNSESVNTDSQSSNEEVETYDKFPG